MAPSGGMTPEVRDEANRMMKALARKQERDGSLARQSLQTDNPEILMAVDAIESSTSLADLDMALKRLCDAYEPLFERLISVEPSDDRFVTLIAYQGIWSNPAYKKGHELVVARTGRTPTYWEFIDRQFEIENRETPGYDLFDNPIPPRLHCRNVIRAIESYS